MIPHAENGAVVWGETTTLLENQSLSSLGVRRTISFITRLLVQVLDATTFKRNTENVRTTVQQQLSGILDMIYQSGGIQGFRVTCDLTNNTALVIDAGLLKASCSIIPLEYLESLSITITTNLATSATSVSFTS